MTDAGEGLVDAEARIQERIEELERARSGRRREDPRNPEAVRALESLKLARAEFARQLERATHEQRRVQLSQAIAEVERRMAQASAELDQQVLASVGT